MQLTKKYVFGKETEVLEVLILDDDDVNLIIREYSHHQCVQMDLSSLQYLDLFSQITTLILTGGIPTKKGFESLYKKTELTALVLDYEETDSDDDGIELAYFPKLKNILSRSDLNIKNLSNCDTQNCTLEVLNYYSLSAKRKINYPPNYDLFRPKIFLFFSTEAHAPASRMLMDILSPAGRNFNNKYRCACFSKRIDNVAIIPICCPESSNKEMGRKERRLVNLKRRYADIRLYISYEAFVAGDNATKYNLCLKNIEEAARYISEKDTSFRYDGFMDAIKNVLYP